MEICTTYMETIPFWPYPPMAFVLFVYCNLSGIWGTWWAAIGESCMLNRICIKMYIQWHRNHWWWVVWHRPTSTDFQIIILSNSLVQYYYNFVKRNSDRKYYKNGWFWVSLRVVVLLKYEVWVWAVLTLCQCGTSTDTVSVSVYTNLNFNYLLTTRQVTKKIVSFLINL